MKPSSRYLFLTNCLLVNARRRVPLAGSDLSEGLVRKSEARNPKAEGSPKPEFLNARDNFSAPFPTPALSPGTPWEERDTRVRTDPCTESRARVRLKVSATAIWSAA